MNGNAQAIKKDAKALLLQWCGGLLRYQLHMPHTPEFDGGLLCPACKMIHGRCTEAVYPLLCAAELTGEERWLTAAKQLFRWGENVRCDDGSLYNDPNSQWAGTTVFQAMALHDALTFHGRLLSPAEQSAWEARLRGMGEWLFRCLRPGGSAYLNYYAANACAMALLGRYFSRKDYAALAKELADYCLTHVSESGLLFGEGHPRSARSPRGCAAIDVGYNAEETLPCLLRYAETAGDETALQRVKTLFRTQLDWMLPDGAWDDSIGTRSFKWTYWGGRTTDGATDALFRLGKTDPLFAEAALRRLTLLQANTRDGLLYGGRDLAEQGEAPCLHHTFCRAKTLASILNADLPDVRRTALPVETADGLFEYPELAVCRLIRGGWIADITANDFRNRKGGHASGGALSLLWHQKCGPVVAVGMADYEVNEPFNQQQTRQKSAHRSPCPRIETETEGQRFAQHYDYAAQTACRDENGALTVTVDALLCDEHHRPKDVAGGCSLRYDLTEQALRISGRVSPALAGHAQYVLPLISDAVTLTVDGGTLLPDAHKGFNLNPGFAFTEYRIRPDRNGRFSVLLTI